MPTGNTGYITEMDVRIWMRDADPSGNLLLNDFEFGTEEIRTAATLAVDYWNETPPSLSGAQYTMYNFPYRYHHLMGTTANLLFIAAHLFRRNRLPSQISGGTVDDQNKFNEYDSAGARLWEQYKQWCALKKREINTQRGWGRI